MTSSNWLRFLIVAVAVLLIGRCVTQAMLPLMHQEAYYWMYAQHPSASYFDHPPVVAWMIGATTGVFGDSEWGVRFGAGLLMLLNGGLMYAFARQWWSRGVAFSAAVLLEISPVYFGIGLLATMDPPLLTFWLLSLIGFSVAVRHRAAWAWYLCGVGLGGALLSKYTGVFIIPGVGLMLLTHRPWRKYLTSPHPYLAVTLGVAMFSPVLIWNYQHDWASFRFQFLSRFDADTSSQKYTVLEFLGLQLAMATPLVLAGMVVLVFRGCRRKRWSAREKIALAFSVPLILVIAKKSLSYPVHVDWTAPAYLSVIPAVIHMASVQVRAKPSSSSWMPWKVGANALTLRACLLIDFVLIAILVVVQPRIPVFRAFGPWEALAEHVERFEEELEATTGREPLVIVDGKYQLASLMAFYRNRVQPTDLPSRTTLNQVALGDTALGYAYWTDRESWRGRDCIFVDTAADADIRLAGVFRSVKTKWTGKAPNGITYTISECRGYRSESERQ